MRNCLLLCKNVCCFAHMYLEMTCTNDLVNVVKCMRKTVRSLANDQDLDVCCLVFERQGDIFNEQCSGCPWQPFDLQSTEWWTATIVIYSTIAKCFSFVDRERERETGPYWLKEIKWVERSWTQNRSRYQTWETSSAFNNQPTSQKSDLPQITINFNNMRPYGSSLFFFSRNIEKSKPLLAISTSQRVSAWLNGNQYKCQQESQDSRGRETK